ncbi:MAG: MerR family transcriptional regulator [Verrucomicrobiaceae bacterium]|nr:MAG: MerR family transcriptional regulator [Verrucomicrobiaceae bacterium]
MKPSSDQDLPLYDANEQATYSLDIVAELTGVSSQTILRYQEQGLIHEKNLDDEAVHTLRRIEHLRCTCETNDSGLRLILNLMDEVDRLRAALRARG